MHKCESIGLGVAFLEFPRSFHLKQVRKWQNNGKCLFVDVLVCGSGKGVLVFVCV